MARDRRSVVLLPLGAVEQHGPHLPLSVDWLGAEELARRVAPHLRRGGWRPVLAPSLPYGASTLAATWSGTVSLSVATTTRLIVEIVRGLATHGFRRFVLTNYQADPDHLRAIAVARRRLQRDGRVQVLVAGFTPADGRPSVMTDPRVRALMRSPRPEREWHSGELETAMMLSVAPAPGAARARAAPAAGVDRLGGGARPRRAAVRADAARAGAATSAGRRRRARRPGGA